MTKPFAFEGKPRMRAVRRPSNHASSARPPRRAPPPLDDASSRVSPRKSRAVASRETKRNGARARFVSRTTARARGGGVRVVRGAPWTRRVVRGSQAEAGIAALREKVDTLIIIANTKLLDVAPTDTSIVDAFLVADDVLRQARVCARRGRRVRAVARRGHVRRAARRCFLARSLAARAVISRVSVSAARDEVCAPRWSR